MTKLIGGNISDTPIKNIGDGSAFSAGGGGTVQLELDLPADINTTYASTTELLAPGSNTDGVLVQWAHLASPSANVTFSSILAKTSSPSSYTDGRAILIGRGNTVPNATNWNPVVIPAGFGIYVVPNGVTVGVNMGWTTLPSTGVNWPSVGESLIADGGFKINTLFTSATNTGGAIVTGFTLSSGDGSALVNIDNGGGYSNIIRPSAVVGTYLGGPIYVPAGGQMYITTWGADDWCAASYTLL